MRGKTLFVATLVLVSALAASPAAAQEDPNLTPPDGARSEAAAPAPADPDAFGLGIQGLDMPATMFVGKLTAGSELVYFSSHFYNNPGSASPQRFFAAIPLPGGSRIFQIECHVNDSSDSNNVTMTFQRYGFDTNSDVPVLGFVRSWSTSDALGNQDIYFFPDEADGTIVTGEGSTRFTYYLSADVAADTSFRGCRLGWRRLVSPSPVVATFPLDTPTTHPFFRFIEALAAAGITGGCGPQQYCPNNPITRGEMAVFLAAALGLHFSH